MSNGYSIIIDTGYGHRNCDLGNFYESPVFTSKAEAGKWFSEMIDTEVNQSEIRRIVIEFRKASCCQANG